MFLLHAHHACASASHMCAAGPHIKLITCRCTTNHTPLSAGILRRSSWQPQVWLVQLYCSPIHTLSTLASAQAAQGPPLLRRMLPQERVRLLPQAQLPSPAAFLQAQACGLRPAVHHLCKAWQGAQGCRGKERLLQVWSHPPWQLLACQGWCAHGRASLRSFHAAWTWSASTCAVWKVRQQHGLPSGAVFKCMCTFPSHTCACCALRS